MRRLKTLDASWVLNVDTDEFLVYNYLGENEDPTQFLSKGKRYRKRVVEKRNQMFAIRQSLPALDHVSIGNFLHQQEVKPCVKVPALRISSHESNLSSVNRNVPDLIDARTLMTLRHRKYGKKDGVSTKCLINLQELPLDSLKQNLVRTIHNPLITVCGMHANRFVGMDYMSSALRLHHYAGTRESFGARVHDARKKYNASFSKRNVNPLGETDAVRPWIAAFVKKVGIEEAQRLLSPLSDAYKNTDWSSTWNADVTKVEI